MATQCGTFRITEDDGGSDPGGPDPVDPSDVFVRTCNNPSEIEEGEPFTVGASVENEGDAEVNAELVFEIAGQSWTQAISIGAGDIDTWEIDVNYHNISPGDYDVVAYTQNISASAPVLDALTALSSCGLCGSVDDEETDAHGVSFR